MVAIIGHLGMNNLGRIDIHLDSVLGSSKGKGEELHMMSSFWMHSNTMEGIGSWGVQVCGSVVKLLIP